jgi:hypothetical protein
MKRKVDLPGPDVIAAEKKSNVNKYRGKFNL